MLYLSILVHTHPLSCLILISAHLSFHNSVRVTDVYECECTSEVWEEASVTGGGPTCG